MTDYQLPPQSIETEESVLSGIMQSANFLDEAIDALIPGDFYKSAHQKIFEACCRLHQEDSPVDLVTLTERMKSDGTLSAIGGATYLAQIHESAPVPPNVSHYCRIIKGKSILRQTIHACQGAIGECYEGKDAPLDLLDRAQYRVNSIQADGFGDDAASVSDIVFDRIEQYEAASKFRGGITGIPSGLYALDAVTAGFQKTDLIVLAARPSMGKTALAVRLAKNAARSGWPVAFVSLEMSREQLTDRFISDRARVDLQRLRTGVLEGHHWEAVTNAAGAVAKWPIYIDDSMQGHYRQVRRIVRRLAKRHGIKLVVVDYLQLMEGDTKTSRDRETAEISRNLKKLAKELDVPVIALSQLNRRLEERKNKRPVLSDLRDSGAIEQDADVVMFLYRDEVYNDDENNAERGIAEINVAKQRNGPTKTVRVQFTNHTASFHNLAYGENQ